MRKQIVLILAIVCLGMELSHAQTATDGFLKKIDSIMAQQGIPGAMISIVRSDTVIYTGGRGYADLHTRERVSGQHLFRLGSISKSFIALALVKLCGEKGISLNTPVERIGDFPVVNKWKAAPVTIAHVLEHTTGFNEIFGSYKKAEDGSPLSATALTQVYKNAFRPRWPPGRLMSYSNANYVLAGALIEALSGRPYAEYVRQAILEPLGMSASGFYNREPARLKVARGYRPEGDTVQPVGYAGASGGPGGDFCSNAEDMARFLQFMLRRDRDGAVFANDSVFDRIETPRTSLAARRGFRSGYGLANASVHQYKHLFRGHGGGIDGFRSLYIYSGDLDLGIAVSVTGAEEDAVTDAILAHFIADNAPDSAPFATVPVPEALQQKFAGYYGFRDHRMDLQRFIGDRYRGMSVRFRKDAIITGHYLGGGEDTLYHTGNLQFRSKGSPHPRLILMEEEQGRPVLQLGTHFGEKRSLALLTLSNIGIALSLVITIVSAITGGLWLLRCLFRRKKPGAGSVLLWLPAVFLLLCPVCMAICLQGYKQPASVHAGSIALFACSLAFGIATLLSIVNAFYVRGRWMRVYALATATSCMVLLVWLAGYGMIPLAFWKQ